MTEPTPASPAKKVSPDGLAVAINTAFADDDPSGCRSWLSVSSRGISAYLTAEQVADWTAV